MLNADDLKTLLQVAAFGSLIAAIGFVADQCTNPRQQLTITTLDGGQLHVDDDDLGAVIAMTPITQRAKPGMVYVELRSAEHGIIRGQALVKKDPVSIHLGRISFKDARDGNTYAASWHGPLLWMSDDLRFNLTGPNPSPQQSPPQRYTWQQAQGACPKGWRLPSHDELNALTTSLGDAASAGAALKASSDHHLNFSLSSEGSYWSSTSNDDHHASALQLRRIAGYSTTRSLNQQELHALDQREKHERPQSLNDRRKQQQRRLARIPLEIDASVEASVDPLVTKTTSNLVKCVRPFNGDKNTLKTH